MAQIPEFKTFAEVLKYLTNNYGKDILKDQERVDNILNDLSSEFLKEKKGLKDAYYCKVIGLLINADKGSEKEKLHALNIARKRLIDSAGLSDDMANGTLLNIVGALGWKLPTVPSSKTNNCDVLQDVPENVYHNVIVEQKTNQVAGSMKKKAKLGFVFPFLFIVLVASGIYYFKTNMLDFPNENDNQVTHKADVIAESAEETTAAVVDSFRNDQEEPAPLDEIAPEETGSTEAFAPTDETQEDVPESAGITERFTVSDIAKLEIKNNYSFNGSNFDILTAYDSSNNDMYFISEAEEKIYAYNVESKEANEVFSFEELISKLRGYNSTSSFYIYGMETNDYSGDIYLYGGDGYESYMWLYNVSQDEVHLIKVDNWENYYSATRLFFISENEFIYRCGGASGDWVIIDLDGNLINKDSIYLDYLFDHKDIYFKIYSAGLHKIGSIYSPDDEMLTSDFGFESADYYNGYLYTLADNNDIYKTDMDNFTIDLYISITDIHQTGKQYLGNRECYGLIMTNDGGFITYDSSNKKLKHVIPNQ